LSPRRQWKFPTTQLLPLLRVAAAAQLGLLLLQLGLLLLHELELLL